MHAKKYGATCELIRDKDHNSRISFHKDDIPQSVKDSEEHLSV